MNAFNIETYSDVVSTRFFDQQHQQGDNLAFEVFQIDSRATHTLSPVSTADLQYHKPSRKSIKRPLRKKKMAHTPITLSIVWDDYA